MELAPVVTWLAAGAIAVPGIVALIRMLEAVFDLDHG